MADNGLIVSPPVNHNGHDTDSSDCDLSAIPELKGYLSKWTNYIHGWQARFIVLKDGMLSYYKRSIFATSQIIQFVDKIECFLFTVNSRVIMGAAV